MHWRFGIFICNSARSDNWSKRRISPLQSLEERRSNLKRWEGALSRGFLRFARNDARNLFRSLPSKISPFGRDETLQKVEDLLLGAAPLLIWLRSLLIAAESSEPLAVSVCFNFILSGALALVLSEVNFNLALVALGKPYSKEGLFATFLVPQKG